MEKDVFLEDVKDQLVDVEKTESLVGVLVAVLVDEEKDTFGPEEIAVGLVRSATGTKP